MAFIRFGQIPAQLEEYRASLEQVEYDAAAGRVTVHRSKDDARAFLARMSLLANVSSIVVGPARRDPGLTDPMRRASLAGESRNVTRDSPKLGIGQRSTTAKDFPPGANASARRIEI